MVARFHGARACGDYHIVAADGNPSAQLDDRAFRSELAAGELERLRDAHDFAHAIEKFEIAMIEVAVDADGAEDGVRFAGGAVHVEAAADQAIDYVLDLRVCGAFLHHDDHLRSLNSFPVMFVGNLAKSARHRSAGRYRYLHLSLPETSRGE